MKRYKCKLCPFITSFRFLIREHVRTAHKIKGKRKEGKHYAPSPISKSYEAITVEDSNNGKI